MGKNQHYIPQFYLKNFSDANQKSIGIFRFKEQKFIRNASIKDSAYRIHLYDDDDAVESLLGEEEAKWNNLVDIFLGKNVTHDTLTMLNEQSEEYVINLFRFISITKTRTAQVGDALANIIKTMQNQLGSAMLPETYKEYFGDVEEITKHPNLMPMRVALNQIRCYSGLDLLVIYNFSRQQFITSDVPVIDINPYYEKRNYKINYGLASMGLQMLLPISGRVCLCLYDRNIYKRRCKDSLWNLRSKHTVNQINNLMVKNAYAQIFFCNDEDERYIRNLCKHQKSADNKGRIEFFGQLIWSYENSLCTAFLLPCFKIKKASLSIPLPSHMAGLIRPDVQSLNDELSTKTRVH